MKNQTLSKSNSNTIKTKNTDDLCKGWNTNPEKSTKIRSLVVTPPKNLELYFREASSKDQESEFPGYILSQADIDPRHIWVAQCSSHYVHFTTCRPCGLPKNLRPITSLSFISGVAQWVPFLDCKCESLGSTAVGSLPHISSRNEQLGQTMDKEKTSCAESFTETWMGYKMPRG